MFFAGICHSEPQNQIKSLFCWRLFRLCMKMNADPLRWTKVGLGKSREKRIYGKFLKNNRFCSTWVMKIRGLPWREAHDIVKFQVKNRSQDILRRERDLKSAWTGHHSGITWAACKPAQRREQWIIFYLQRKRVSSPIRHCGTFSLFFCDYINEKIFNKFLKNNNTFNSCVCSDGK